MKKRILFWNVDTQIDFMEEQGKLSVPEATTLKPTLQEITDFARLHSIQVINTADWHHADSSELSDQPNFTDTFPPHCMAYSVGASYIKETSPRTPYTVVEWDCDYSKEEIALVAQAQNIVIHKDAFDVFEGNPYALQLVEHIAPTQIFVYGVATNVCVDCAVMGLAALEAEICVIDNAIKGLPNIEPPFSKWAAAGVKRKEWKEVKAQLNY